MGLIRQTEGEGVSTSLPILGLSLAGDEPVKKGLTTAALRDLDDAVNGRGYALETQVLHLLRIPKSK